MIWYDTIWIIGFQTDCFEGDPLRRENQLLSNLIHSYPLLSTLIPLLSHSYQLLSTLIISYRTLIQLWFTLDLKSDVVHSSSLLSNLNKNGHFRINGIYSILIWNGVSMGEMVAQNESQRERLGCSGRLQSGTGGTSQTLASCKFACPSTVGILLTFGSVLGRRPQLGIFQTSATNEIFVWS